MDGLTDGDHDERKKNLSGGCALIHVAWKRYMARS